MIVATRPINGIFVPTSRPRTKDAPINPSKTPNHCFEETFSPKIGPLSAFVRTGCNVTIKAAIPVGIPIEIEKNTPPK